MEHLSLKSAAAVTEKGILQEPRGMEVNLPTSKLPFLSVFDEDLLKFLLNVWCKLLPIKGQVYI